MVVYSSGQFYCGFREVVGVNASSNSPIIRNTIIYASIDRGRKKGIVEKKGTSPSSVCSGFTFGTMVYSFKLANACEYDFK